LHQSIFSLNKKLKSLTTKTKIGLIRGGGTGGQLLAIFENFLTVVAQELGKEILFVRDTDKKGREYIYHSYKSLSAVAVTERDFKQLSKKDAKRLQTTMERWNEEGFRHVFRTSINAEALYYFRKKVGAVKESIVPSVHGNLLIFIRDQTEGFYTNDRYRVTDEKITFTGSYTKAAQHRVAKYALQRGREIFKTEDFECWGLYKNHLFGNTLEKWFEELDEVKKHKESGDFKIIQPDTGFSELIKFMLNENATQRKLVVFCSNEVGDIIHEPILNMANVDAKIDAYTKNIYLNFWKKNKNLDEFTEYQTVHGSADDIADGESDAVLLPYATLRIASAIGEELLGIDYLSRLVEKGIEQSYLYEQQHISTDAIVQTVTHFVLNNLIKP
jgi:isocitrate/isopropylmalate dehydrogenase